MADYSLGAPHLSRKTKLGYGFGHILNDTCASMWFTYLLVYLQYVLRLDKGLAGFLLLLGQVADAVATPFVGIQSDKGLASSFFRYGRRKTWHALGTICVLLSFPFIFIMCWPCNLYWPYVYVILIGFMIVIFQFGWASVQVSHLAMIPDLTPNEEERDELNIIRYFFDMLSDVLVYVIIWLTFKAGENDQFSNKIDPSDFSKFRTTAICILVIGSFFSLLFHVFTPEAPWRPEPSEMFRKNSPAEDEDEKGLHQRPALPTGTAEAEDLSLRISMTWRDWVYEPQFYYVSLIYTCARLVGNLSNIYMPIFLQETVKTREELIALIPLIMSLSGCAGSLLLKVIRRCASKKASLVIAILIGLFATAIAFMRPLSEFGVYLIAILFGLSGSIMIILSLAFTADLIGYCTDSSAFVYGSMSFWDKLVNGLSVFLIQELSINGCFGSDCSAFYRHVMSLGIMVPLLVGLVGLCIISSVKLGKTRKMRTTYRPLLEPTEDTRGSRNLQVLRETVGSSGGTPISSDSSEFLIATDSKLGYGTLASI